MLNILLNLKYNKRMEKQYKALQEGLEKMKLVTMSAAIQETQLSREEIINFVKAHEKLRIFDDLQHHWINENVDGHC